MTNPKYIIESKIRKRGKGSKTTYLYIPPELKYFIGNREKVKITVNPVKREFVVKY